MSNMRAFNFRAIVSNAYNGRPIVLPRGILITVRPERKIVLEPAPYTAWCASWGRLYMFYCININTIKMRGVVVFSNLFCFYRPLFAIHLGEKILWNIYTRVILHPQRKMSGIALNRHFAMGYVHSALCAYTPRCLLVLQAHTETGKKSPLQAQSGLVLFTPSAIFIKALCQLLLRLHLHDVVHRACIYADCFFNDAVARAENQHTPGKAQLMLYWKNKVYIYFKTFLLKWRVIKNGTLHF